MSSQLPKSSSDEFQDPLENYDPKQYDDPLEEALATLPVSAIQSTPYAGIDPNTPISEAIQRLAGLQVACLLVEEQQKLLGVFSDRDALDKVALEYDEMKDRPVRDVMTSRPVFVYDSDSSAAVLTVMAVHGFRHVPVVSSSDGKIVGIVSPHRVTGFLQSYFETKQ
ncbi:CBS domain-containing protein [Aeoliella sp. ICT_H6.2]|uniref:CBS domain-containing protein n=1 Tax=Aeoliella straminimaris TaxID=2954799 RepID=A0A9X2JG87_9BACT|nr:CBS domain-containing protein [Aeoliella straminimaris]MCO6043258.1 CBS domain-containing protein [Aeoliella straminimaris]